jgi:hypothetical protein
MHADDRTADIGCAVELSGEQDAWSLQFLIS